MVFDAWCGADSICCMQFVIYFNSLLAALAILSALASSLLSFLSLKYHTVKSACIETGKVHEYACSSILDITKEERRREINADVV